MKLKNILSIMLIGLVLLTGCAEKPEVTVTAYFDELKTSISPDLKTIAIEKYFDQAVEIEETNQDLSLESFESNEMTDRYLELFRGFEYKVIDSKIEGDSAVVNVEITTYPVGELLSNYMVQLFSKVFEWAFSGITEEEITAKSTTLFLDLAAEVEKTYVKTVPVYMVKKEGKWLISGDTTNYEMMDALTGGILEFAKQLEENTSESNG